MDGWIYLRRNLDLNWIKLMEIPQMENKTINRYLGFNFLLYIFFWVILFLILLELIKMEKILNILLELLVK